MECSNRTREKFSSSSRDEQGINSLTFFLCQVCSKTFCLKKNLINHSKTHHPNHQLNVCSKSFYYRTSTKNPAKTCRPAIKFICVTCDSSIASRKGLKTHFKVVHMGLRPYSCSFCNKGYGDLTALKDHINVNHTIKKDTFKCDKCAKVFISKGCLRSHRLRHGLQKTHHCQLCNVSFYTLTEKRKHLQTHGSRIKNLKCSLCEKLFISSQTYKNHVKRVHESVIIKKQICIFCNQAFALNQILFDHLRRHIKERPHQCELRRKIFCTNSEKNTHMRTHTKEKPFKCSKCGHGFAIKRNLSRHELTHFKTKLVKPLPCVFCGEDFPTNIQLWHHISREVGERAYMCKLCPKEFRIRGELNCHVRYTHQPGAYKCDKCDKVFTFLQTLKSHNHRKHKRNR